MIPTLSRPPFINKLHERLIGHPLPGQPAHMAMAHAVRKVDVAQNTRPSREAGVLIVLFEKSPGDFHLVFIRRGSSHEQDKHAGQIGFPGGKSEQEDKDMMYTAMREAEEEVGIDLSQVDILGSLTPLYITVSKYLVHPFVAYSWTEPQLTRQESEIEEILELPLSGFRSPMAVQETKISLTTGITLNHVPSFKVDGHIIWGATAMIMNELLEVIA